MKYIANPIEVEAFRIEAVDAPDVNGNVLLRLESGPAVATPAMTARYMPVPGDYWVVQADGYSYLNPKDVFERKYRPPRTG